VACFKPLRGYRSKFPNGSGKYPIVFGDAGPSAYEAVEVRCGQCIGCRLDYSRDWAVRCVHEASLFEENCFVTCTYDEDHLPIGGTLVRHHFVDFIKRLRDDFSFRFFMCGEYGEQLSRPHYHAVFFGLDFEDKRIWKRGEYPLYRSEYLERKWKRGMCIIGAVNYDTAAYCARYIVKRIRGVDAWEHYQNFDCLTGEIYELEPEYCTMSRRPGIGAAWFDLYSDEVFPEDEVFLRGHCTKPPRFYEKLLEIVDPDVLEGVKRERVEFLWNHLDDCTPARLKSREMVKSAQVGQLHRVF